MCRCCECGQCVVVVSVGEENSSSDADANDDRDSGDDDDVVTKVAPKPRSKPSHRPPRITAPGNVMHIRRAFTAVIEQGQPTVVCL